MNPELDRGELFVLLRQNVRATWCSIGGGLDQIIPIHPGLIQRCTFVHVTLRAQSNMRDHMWWRTATPQNVQNGFSLLYFHTMAEFFSLNDNGLRGPASMGGGGPGGVCLHDDSRQRTNESGVEPVESKDD